MPLDSMLEVHTVKVMKTTFTQGDTMAVVRTSRFDRDIKCRIVPLSVQEREVLMRMGYQVSDKMLTYANPNLTINQKVMFNGVVLRVVPPMDWDHQERVWATMLLAHSDDNESLDSLE